MNVGCVGVRADADCVQLVRSKEGALVRGRLQSLDAHHRRFLQLPFPK